MKKEQQIQAKILLYLLFSFIIVIMNIDWFKMIVTSYLFLFTGKQATMQKKQTKLVNS